MSSPFEIPRLFSRQFPSLLCSFFLENLCSHAAILLLYVLSCYQRALSDLVLAVPYFTVNAGIQSPLSSCPGFSGPSEVTLFSFLTYPALTYAVCSVQSKCERAPAEALPGPTLWCELIGNIFHAKIRVQVACLDVTASAVERLELVAFPPFGVKDEFYCHFCVCVRYVEF